MKMEAISTIARPACQPLPTLTKLASAATAALGLALVYLQAGMLGELVPPLAVFAGLMLLAAALMTTGWRWAPLLGTLLGLMVIGGNAEHIVYDLTHPEAFKFFAFALVALALALAAAVLGIAATVQNYRSGERRAPRGTTSVLAAFAALCLGAILVAALPREASAGASPEALAQLPAFTIGEMRFEQQELKAKAGQVVALRLDNQHGAPHSFDVDELNVHVPVGSNGQSLILFAPTKPGTYTFYCGVPGHRAAGMEGKLIVES